MAEAPSLLWTVLMGAWVPAYAFIAWAAWYRFRGTPAGSLLAVGFGLHAAHTVLVAADQLGALGGLTRDVSAHPIAYGIFWSVALVLMAFQVAGLALIPLSLERLRSQAGRSQLGA